MDRRSFFAVSATAGFGLLAGCSTGPSGSSSTGGASGAATSEAGATYPVEVKHALGTTTIKSRPSRVATLGWSDGDIALGLGVVPIGAPTIDGIGNKAGSTDYFDAELKKVDGEQPRRYSEADGAPIDEIAKVRPDIILATSSGITEEDYAKLSKIAPVIAYPDKPYTTPWVDAVTMIGRALGREERAKASIAKTRKLIRDTKKKFPELVGTTYGWTYFAPTDLSRVGLTTGLDMRSQTLEEFGLEPSPFVAQVTKGAKQYAAWVSAEKAGKIDADVICFQELVENQDEKVTKHELVGKIPALQRGTYASGYQDQGMAGFSAPSPLSLPYAVEHFIPRLAEAARKAKDSS